MSQNHAKYAIYKAILPLDDDVNQPSQLFNFDLDQVLIPIARKHIMGI